MYRSGKKRYEVNQREDACQSIYAMLSAVVYSQDEYHFVVYCRVR